MNNIGSLVLMIISEILIVGVYILIRQTTRKSQLKTAFNWILFTFFIWTLGSILQIVFQNSSIEPVFFEKIACIGVHFLRLYFYLWQLLFQKQNLHLNGIILYYLLFL